MSTTIATLWNTRRQKPKTHHRKLQMIRYLETQLFNDLTFTMAGSSANGFGFDNSDVDLCLEVEKLNLAGKFHLILVLLEKYKPNHSKPQVKNNILPLALGECLDKLTDMKRRMKKDDHCKKLLFIPAICPILKFEFSVKHQ